MFMKTVKEIFFGGGEQKLIKTAGKTCASGAKYKHTHIM